MWAYFLGETQFFNFLKVNLFAGKTKNCISDLFWKVTLFLISHHFNPAWGMRNVCDQPYMLYTFLKFEIWKNERNYTRRSQLGLSEESESVKKSVDWTIECSMQAPCFLGNVLLVPSRLDCLLEFSELTNYGTTFPFRTHFPN